MEGFPPFTQHLASTGKALTHIADQGAFKELNHAIPNTWIENGTIDFQLTIQLMRQPSFGGSPPWQSTGRHLVKRQCNGEALSMIVPAAATWIADKRIHVGQSACADVIGTNTGK
ncbi:hypothetical protein D3C87_1203800 [compost metagenome]